MTAPLRSGWKATPSSMAPLSSAAAVSGTAEVSQSVAAWRQLVTVVVNDHVRAAAMALPDVSVARTDAV